MNDRLADAAPEEGTDAAVIKAFFTSAPLDESGDAHFRSALRIAVEVGHEAAALGLLGGAKAFAKAPFEEGGGGAALLQRAAGLGRAEVVAALHAAPDAAWGPRDLRAAVHAAAVSGRADAARLLAPALRGAPLPGDEGLPVLAALALDDDKTLCHLVLDSLGPGAPGPA